MWFLALFTLVGAFLLLGLSVFPGVLEQVPASLWLPLAALFVLVVFISSFRNLMRSRSATESKRRISPYLVLATLILTPLLLANHIPRRLMFNAYRSEFESMLKDAPAPAEHSTVPLNADLAYYWVDQWGTDRRGGVYFRTLGAGQKGGSDRRSYGFAFQPNPDGSPFGDGKYTFHRLHGDWYTFSAADE